MAEIVEIAHSNYQEIARLASKLWPDSSLEEEKEYFHHCISDTTHTAFLLTVNTKSVGFVLVSLRTDFVEGTKSKPVCYIEGIYVEPPHRRKGYAELLIQKAEHWGKEMNCTEIASDAEINNMASIAFHKRIGFKEINRVVCFAKAIS